MKSPVDSTRAVGFIAVTSTAWLIVVHGIAFYAFGATAMAAWVIFAGLASTLAGIISYISWEFRQAKPAKITQAAPPVQDVSLLMLSRSAHTPRHFQRRRTRTRLHGEHPVTNRIVALHRPPHLDQRMKKQGAHSDFAMNSLLNHSTSRTRITPSAN
ncbi:hypothetical protein [Haloferula sp.]|uniref:hypothetical protein n=1 Tax=Haloferula sp. TaxID=2497595 RepID=UPI0032A0CD69